MEKEAKPVHSFTKLEKILKNYDLKHPTARPAVDFSNTEIAFEGKSDEELKKTAWLFKMMNKQWLVDIGAKVGLAAIRMHLPLIESVIKSTIFDQFCGGTTLLESQGTINHLFKHQVLTILDYGVERKEREEDFNNTMNEIIRAIEFASRNESVPVVSTKITGLARMGLLENVQNSKSLSKEQQLEYKSVLKRIDSICHLACRRNVQVFFDAEESWIQDAIDHLVNSMMARYNTKRVVVYNTFQLYRNDRLQYLMDSFYKAEAEGYLLGAKLVRGAYMDKEREKAEKMGYPSPIQLSKAATDDAYDTAIRFCVDNFEKIASCNASHNSESCLLQAELIAQKGIQKNHPNLNFCQLFGMSDTLTFNLAKAGYNVAKYVPYGPIPEVIPYLIRRAEENASITGDMSRELELILREVERRG